MQAWLLEKPAARADENAPCLAAALMERKRPREDALLEAERSHQRHLILQLDWELLGELCAHLRRRVDGLNNIINRERESALKSCEKLDAAALVRALGLKQPSLRARLAEGRWAI